MSWARLMIPVINLFIMFLSTSKGTPWKNFVVKLTLSTPLESAMVAAASLNKLEVTRWQEGTQDNNDNRFMISLSSESALLKHEQAHDAAFSSTCPRLSRTGG